MNISRYLGDLFQSFQKNEKQKKVPHKKPEKLRDEIAASGMGGGLGPKASQVKAELPKTVSVENTTGFGGNSPTILGGE